MAGNINLSGRGDLLWPFTVSYCHNLLLRRTLFELYLVLRIKKKIFVQVLKCFHL